MILVSEPVVDHTYEVSDACITWMATNLHSNDRALMHEHVLGENGLADRFALLYICGELDETYEHLVEDHMERCAFCHILVYSLQEQLAKIR